jgi:hypothetical protein
MPAQAEREAPFRHRAPDLDDLPLAIQEHNVNREFHPDGVDAFARNNPQTFSRIQPRTPQQASITGGGGVGYVGTVRENGTPSLISHAQFWQTLFNPAFSKLLRWRKTCVLLKGSD